MISYLIYSEWDVTESTIFWNIFHEFPIYGPKLFKFICRDKQLYYFSTNEVCFFKERMYKI